MREYLDNITTAATAKEERMQEMAESARRKDEQLSEMMSRLDAKDKQMSDLVAQVTTMNTSTGGRRNEDNNKNNNNKNTQQTRNRKRKGVGGGGADRNDPLTKWFLKGWSYKDHKFNNKWPEWKKDHWRVVTEAQIKRDKKAKKEPTKAEKVA